MSDGVTMTVEVPVLLRLKFDEAFNVLKKEPIRGIHDAGPGVAVTSEPSERLLGEVKRLVEDDDVLVKEIYEPYVHSLRVDDGGIEHE